MPETRTVKVLLDGAGRANAIDIPRCSLRILKGPAPRRERSFGSARIVLGSSAAADFSIADLTVSAIHCEIVAGTRGFAVRDLGAKNGVGLAGRRVGEAWLARKDQLTLGETVVQFEDLEEAERVSLVRSSLGGLVGGSPIMRELYMRLEKAAQANASVLLAGETGAGKELAAEALVACGPRPEGPFVVVDCGQLTASLAESELFGHERGAFTGATAPHAGAFERANGGTVFLDEVGELPPELQPKLLGVLERRLVQRVGGSQPVPVDVRVIAATHRNLPAEVNRGAFRADLYFRLAAVEVRLPSLREHPEDVPELISHFLSEIPGASTLAPDVFTRLCKQDYPGNVRQLRNEVERAVLGLDSPPLPSLPAEVTLNTPFRIQKERLLGSFERAYLIRLLDAAGGNISDAARRSGLSRVRLYEMMRRWRLPQRP